MAAGGFTARRRCCCNKLLKFAVNLLCRGEINDGTIQLGGYEQLGGGWNIYPARSLLLGLRRLVTS